MCGRFTLTPEPSEILRLFPGLTLPSEGVARYNIAPTQRVLAVTSATGEARFEMLSWGLIPAWAKDVRIASSLINARADTVREKPAFRAAFRARRCLIVADGFYEWRTDGKRKRPFHFRLSSGGVFAFAGLWESFATADTPLRTCALITTDANAVVAPVHHRMPVILPLEAHAAWLDPASSPAALSALLVPYAADQMTGWEVSSLVSSPRNDSPACLAPLQGARGSSSVETLALFGDDLT